MPENRPGNIIGQGLEHIDMKKGVSGYSDRCVYVCDQHPSRRDGRGHCLFYKHVRNAARL